MIKIQLNVTYSLCINSDGAIWHEGNPQKFVQISLLTNQKGGESGRREKIRNGQNFWIYDQSNGS